MNSAEIKSPMRCPLCGSADNVFFFEDKSRTYLRCPECALIFVPPEFHVSAEEEKERYEEHNNDYNDAGYRRFLERITDPVGAKFSKGAEGLDFGCGPTPLLAGILNEMGFDMEVFDPFYAANRAVLETEYDFVVTTEVVEHLAAPLETLKKMFSLIRPDGMLAVMTRPFDESIDFKGWHYKNDCTHICFFCLEAFDWISEEMNIPYRRVENDIFVFDRQHVS